MAIRQSGFDPQQGLLTPAEIAARQVTTGRVYERMWRYLTHGDPEQQRLLDSGESEI